MGGLRRWAWCRVTAAGRPVFLGCEVPAVEPDHGRTVTAMRAGSEQRRRRRRPPPPDVRRTACCVVGAGPAGAVLALLLARQGIPVVLLEAQGDFDRDFRGDTVHPACWRPWTRSAWPTACSPRSAPRARTITVPTAPPVQLGFGRLRTRFPFIAVMRQAQSWRS